MTISPKFFEAFMRHIIRKNSGEKIKLFLEFFIKKTFEKLVIFISKQSL
jgi:hypothetical protein